MVKMIRRTALLLTACALGGCGGQGNKADNESLRQQVGPNYQIQMVDEPGADGSTPAPAAP